MTSTCPCGSKNPYATCCEPIITGKTAAHTAEQLMRTRYTAFTQANGTYLLKTWHSSERNKQNQKEIEHWAKSVIWLKLEINEVIAGTKSDSEGYVIFQAFFQENGKVFKIHEKSLFQREKGLWVYHSGVHF